MYLITMKLADGQIKAFTYGSIAEGQADAERNGANIQAVQKGR